MTTNLCQDICGKLGFGCETLAAEDGGIMALDTPFGFSDGTPFTIYAEHLNGMVRFFDSQETLFPRWEEASVRFNRGSTSR
ncbi:hypothetical protein [Burkholderia sp. Ed8]|uniref:hypothetical protein n=1 Tax=Burkholderia sp. Ed8 TaxID=3112957 RepID=UPI00345CF92E